MIRIFHPVGQGAFYTEKFNDFTLIYDCGSDKGKQFIEEEIPHVFLKKSVIDVLFISHLHDDHVNGIEFLLSNYSLKKLFLPLISNSEKIYLLIHNAMTSERDNFIERLIWMPEELIKEKALKGAPKLILVKPVTRIPFDQDNVSIDTFRNLKSNIKSGIRIKQKKEDEWIFLPFNFQNKTRSAILVDELKKRSISIDNINDFDKLWKDASQQKQLIEAYNAVPGNLNTNSLVLYSGPEKGSKFGYWPYNTIPIHSFGSLLSWDAGCLYLGDYDANGKKGAQLIKNFQFYWNSIGTLQIPHHGSSLNYNPVLNSRKPVVSVISAGYSNKYNHPHASTVSQILENNGVPIFVNEHVGSRAVFEVYGI
jgi:hypothetical protein